MSTSNSPLESLAAYVIVFVLGVLTVIGLRKYIEMIKTTAQGLTPSA